MDSSGITPFSRSRYCETDFIDVEGHLPETLVYPSNENEPLANSETPDFIPLILETPKQGGSSNQDPNKSVSPFYLRPPPKLP